MSRTGPALARRVVDDFVRLLRLQIALARELLQDAVRPARQAGALAAAGIVLAVVGLLCVVGAAVAALSFVLPVWLAFLASAGAFVGLGLALVLIAARRLKEVGGRLSTAAAELNRELRWTTESET